MSSDSAKYLTINVVAILTTYAVYDLLVKRTDVTRVQFGIKPQAQKTSRR